MNTYNLFDSNDPSTILYHAIAENEEQVKKLAQDNGFNITGLQIDLERKNVKSELGKGYSPSISNALIS
jgi:hypothetical protein